MNKREDRLYLGDLLPYFSNDYKEVIKIGDEIGASIRGEDGKIISFDKDIFNKYLVENDMSFSGIHSGKKKKDSNAKSNKNYSLDDLINILNEDYDEVVRIAKNYGAAVCDENGIAISFDKRVIDTYLSSSINKECEAMIRKDERLKTLDMFATFLYDLKMQGELIHSLYKDAMRELYNFKYDIENLDEARNTFERSYSEWVTELMAYIEDGEEEYEKVVGSNKETCCVYFIINEELSLIKIGVSHDPWERIKGMQTSTGYLLDILHVIEFDDREQAMDAERFLHDYFIRDRVKKLKHKKSSEWFNAAIQNELKEKFWDKESVIREMKEDKKWIKKEAAKIYKKKTGRSIGYDDIV